MMKLREEPEFSRPVDVADIGPEGLDCEIEAGSDERKRLRERLGLLSLDKLTAKLRLAASPSGVSIKVSGRYVASVAQECVVTLEPVESVIDETLEAEFGPGSEETDITLTLDEPEPAEPLVDGRIDIGELVVQYLAMALDPYPRKTGAQLPDLSKLSAGIDNESEDSPFSVLAALRKKD